MTSPSLCLVLIGSLLASAQLVPSPAPPAGAMRPFLAALSVSSVDRSAAWYAAHFGFRILRPPASPRPGVYQAILERDGFYLELASLAGSRPRSAALAAPGQNASLQGVYKLAFWVPDADSALAALRDAGIAIPRGSGLDSAFAGGTRYFLLEDPDGTVLQVFGPLR